MRFDAFTLALLTRCPDAPRLDPQAAEELQDAHLDHLARMHEDGQLLMAGPLLVAPSEPLRGVCLFRGAADDVRKLGEDDPMVKAGQLTYRLLPWQVPAGTATFSKTRFPHSMRDVGGP